MINVQLIRYKYVLRKILIGNLHWQIPWSCLIVLLNNDIIIYIKQIIIKVGRN